MLNVGPLGPPFVPYEGRKASKSGRSRNEGIPEGASPVTNVIFSKSGNLYGTTVNGGSASSGAAFKLAFSCGN